jgi:hypothetical protein
MDAINNTNNILNNLNPLLFVICVIGMFLSVIKSLVKGDNWINISIQILISCILLAFVNDINKGIVIGNKLILFIESIFDIKT